MTIDEQVEKRVYNRLRAYDGVEVAGHAPVNSSIASVLSEGEVLADNGEQYSSIQQAVDVSDGFVFVGPGTYYENVVIDKDDFTLQGAGRDTLIDGGATGNCIRNTGNDVTITSLSVQTTDTNASVDCIDSDSNKVIFSNIKVRESTGIGITSRGNNCIIRNCTLGDYGNAGYGIATRVSGDYNVVVDNIYEPCSNTSGEEEAQISIEYDSVVANNTMLEGGISASLTGGIRVAQHDNVIIGNRIINATADGITVTGSAIDNIIANNRISDSGGNGDIDNNATGTVLDGNLTGSAN